MTCEAETLYLSPSRKASLRQILVEAVVGDERIEIRHRRDVQRLIDEHGWDGTCVVTPREGGKSEILHLDPRLVYGHLPENASWWRVSQILDGATIEQVGGAKQLSEVLFGRTSRVLGNAAFEEISAGRGSGVTLLSGLLNGEGGSLLEPDVIARVLRETANHPARTLEAAFDPEQLAAGRMLLEQVAPGAREEIVRGLLCQLPSGMTAKLARNWSVDSVRCDWIMSEASWHVAGYALETALEQGRDAEEFAALLRNRGVLGACHQGDFSALELALRVPSLREAAVEIWAADARELILSPDAEQRRQGVLRAFGLAEHAGERAVELARLALHDVDPDVRETVAGTLRHYVQHTPEAAKEMFAVLLSDVEPDVRTSAANKLEVLAKTAPREALSFVEQTLDDPETISVTPAALRALIPLAESFPDEVADIVERCVQERASYEWYALLPLPLVAERRPERGLALIEEALRSESWQARHRAADGLYSLCETHPAEVARLVSEVLLDEDDGMRQAATRSLGALAKASPEHARPLLKWALHDRDEYVISGATWGLSGLAAHDPSGALAMFEGALERAVDDTRLYDQILSSLPVLADGAPTIALPLIEKAIAETNPYRQQKGVDAIRYLREAVPEKAAALFERAVTGDDAHWRGSDISDDVEELRATLIHMAPQMAGLADDAVVEIVRSGLMGENLYLNSLAGEAVRDIYETHPETGRRVLEGISSKQIIDPEVALSLAGHGVLAVESKLSEQLVDAWRAARLDQEAAADLRATTTASQLLGLASRFSYDTDTLDALDERPLEISGKAYSTRVIRSRAELEKNAADMHNCTSGYASRLVRGDVMIAVRDESGRPRFNAHLTPTEQGWRISQVNSQSNMGGEECNEVRQWLRGNLSNLPVPEIPSR